jgi:phage terminase large subunit-like protein
MTYQKKTKKQVKSDSSKPDRATTYAQAVVSGGIVAGLYVRGACQRHLDDLQDAGERGFYYDEHAAAEAIAFFEECLCLNGGQFEGKPFILFGWEAFIIGSIFGWKRKSDNMRRFRVVFVETAKGSGKSPLCAGTGIKGLVADNEARAEIYAAATFKDQAMVLFRDACAFYDQSPELQRRLTASGVGEKRWSLAYLKTNSFFRVIASDTKKGKSGPRPHMALLDEIHEHTDGNIIEMLRAGFKFRRQPLSFMITNSGHDKTSVCWEYHDMGIKISCGQVQNDEFFAYICSLNEEDLKDDKYLTDESTWIKANPSLDAGIPGYDYIRGQITEAQGMPSKMSTVKRLCFCVWTEAENPWISAEVWNPCRDSEFEESLLNGRRCWGALDLSAINDLTSYNLIFEPTEEDPIKRLKSFFWIPGENIRRKSEIDHVPYDVWVKQGHLLTSPGPTIRKTDVIKFIHGTSLKYDIQGIAYDRDRMPDLIEFAGKAEIDLAIGKWDKEKRQWKFDNQTGIKMMPFGQGAKSMAPAIDKFETFLFNKEIRHDGNPVQTWCMANAVVKDDDEDGYRKISKRKSIGRVDGAVTAVMAAGILENQPVRSVMDGLTKEQMIARMTGKEVKEIEDVRIAE